MVGRSGAYCAHVDLVGMVSLSERALRRSGLRSRVIHQGIACQRSTERCLRFPAKGPARRSQHTSTSLDSMPASQLLLAGSHA
jgi:hypothetical protein